MNSSVFKKNLIPYLQLTKPVITLSVAFSALTGFLLGQGAFSNYWGALYAGVLLVAAGSSALNQVQEARYDHLMERTRNRPIPSGRLPVSSALWLVAVLVTAGISILLVFTNFIPAVLALLTLAWYNGIYTPLKRITAYAILPGAVVGAIPPAIGWTASGGSLFDQTILLVALFFFIGQIPHFWLILLKHGKDYEKAGFPALTIKFSREQITIITLLWTVATAIAALLLPVFGIIRSEWLSVLTGVFALLLLVSFRNWVGSYKLVNVRRAFIVMNTFYLLMMIIIIADALLRQG
jgi:heme o synthase